MTRGGVPRPRDFRDPGGPAPRRPLRRSPIGRDQVPTPRRPHNQRPLHRTVGPPGRPAPRRRPPEVKSDLRAAGISFPDLIRLEAYKDRDLPSFHLDSIVVRIASDIAKLRFESIDELIEYISFSLIEAKEHGNSIDERPDKKWGRPLWNMSKRFTELIDKLIPVLEARARDSHKQALEVCAYKCKSPKREEGGCAFLDSREECKRYMGGSIFAWNSGSAKALIAREIREKFDPSKYENDFTQAPENIPTPPLPRPSQTRPVETIEPITITRNSGNGIIFLDYRGSLVSVNKLLAKTQDPDVPVVAKTPLTRELLGIQARGDSQALGRCLNDKIIGACSEATGANLRRIELGQVFKLLDFLQESGDYNGNYPLLASLTVTDSVKESGALSRLLDKDLTFILQRISQGMLEPNVTKAAIAFLSAFESFVSSEPNPRVKNLAMAFNFI